MSQTPEHQDRHATGPDRPAGGGTPDPHDRPATGGPSAAPAGRVPSTADHYEQRRRAAEDAREIALLAAKNERLVDALRQAREKLAEMQEQLDELGRPPATFATFLEAREDGTAEVIASGRKMQLQVAPQVELGTLRDADQLHAPVRGRRDLPVQFLQRTRAPAELPEIDLPGVG